MIYWGGKDGYAPDRKALLTGIGTVTAAGCDVNDDGHPDLITVNCAENAMHLDPGSFVFYGSKQGFRRDPDLALPTRSAMALIVADVNRDGYLDAIFSSFSTHEILIFFGNEHGFDAKNPQRIVVEEDGVQYIDGRRMCLADLNNDGYLDLVLTFNANDRTFVLWGGPDGFSFDRRQTLSVTRSSTPMAADLTGNGYLDLIIGGHKRSDTGPHDSFVHIYWNGPEGLREDRKTLLPSNAVLGMALADFNNDGVKDLLVVNYSNGREPRHRLLDLLGHGSQAGRADVLRDAGHAFPHPLGFGLRRCRLQRGRLHRPGDRQPQDPRRSSRRVVGGVERPQGSGLCQPDQTPDQRPARDVRRPAGQPARPRRRGILHFRALPVARGCAR